MIGGYTLSILTFLPTIAILFI